MDNSGQSSGISGILASLVLALVAGGLFALGFGMLMSGASQEYNKDLDQSNFSNFDQYNTINSQINNMSGEFTNTSTASTGSDAFNSGFSSAYSGALLLFNIKGTYLTVSRTVGTILAVPAQMILYIMMVISFMVFIGLVYIIMRVLI